jgi:hypothetical protein
MALLPAGRKADCAPVRSFNAAAPFQRSRAAMCCCHNEVKCESSLCIEACYALSPVAATFAQAVFAIAVRSCGSNRGLLSQRLTRAIFRNPGRLRRGVCLAAWSSLETDPCFISGRKAPLQLIISVEVIAERLHVVCRVIVRSWQIAARQEEHQWNAMRIECMHQTIHVRGPGKIIGRREIERRRILKA